VSKRTDSNFSKRQQVHAERQRQQWLWNLILLGTGGVVVLLIAWYFVATARPGTLPGEVTVPDEGRAHVPAHNPDGSPSGQRVQYQTYPPASGTHYGDMVAPWGVYTSAEPLQPNLPADSYDLEGIFVHNLEHGGVVFLYTCAESCPELEQQFRALYDKAGPPAGCPSKMILALPYNRPLPTPIVALAWDHRMDVAQFDENLLLRWYQRFMNRGPEKLC
jgi:hypothetical protein